MRGFIDGYYAQPETLGVARAAARAIDAINAWVAAQARVDAQLKGMATTFSAAIFAKRKACVAHVGDSRVYRLDAHGLERLTSDHVMGRGDFANVLTRAVGAEDRLLLDITSIALSAHDRFLLCTDGVHGPLDARALRELLSEAFSPQETANRIVAAALAAGGADNATALVADITDLPPADARELSEVAASLSIGELPQPGAIVDGFRLEEIVSDGRYSRLLRATDLQGGRTLILKFPHPRVARDASYRGAFVNEAWVAARVRSPFVGEIVELPAGRQTRLYSAMPFYEGETLEQRLRRAPKLDLAEGARIASELARGVAALHRAGVIHRDIKPENVILLEDGGLRLIDLGVCRAPHLEDISDAETPGTPSYLAPEMFLGAAGDEMSDLYALGVTLYRAFCGAYPYGEIEPFSKPRFGKPQSLIAKRPDLPAWLDAVMLKAIAPDPAERYRDVLEFAFEIENGAARAPTSARRPKSLYERNPLMFWKATSLLLLFALVLALACRRG